MNGRDFALEASLRKVLRRAGVQAVKSVWTRPRGRCGRKCAACALAVDSGTLRALARQAGIMVFIMRSARFPDRAPCRFQVIEFYWT